jgi:2-polyprenyl-6-hydroxyphenyl methylase/3-demethylubiquinone-9 3-methyltransferase
MKQLRLDAGWPDSWKYSFAYDRMEIYGERDRRGYAYAYAERRRRTLAMVARAAAPAARVLDVAAAQGNFTLALAELGYDVTWNDLRADLADYVRLKHERGTVRFAPGNVMELGFVECFDVVLITEIIEHVAHPDQFLTAISRIVRPGGHIVMSTPNGAYFLNALPRFSDHPDPSVFESRQFAPNADGHIFLLHTDEIRALAAVAGLRVVDHQVFANPLTNGHLKSEMALRILPRAIVLSLESLTSRLPFRETFSTSMVTLLQKPAAV